jgi:3-deoxy-D-manno-octulosonic-acid transferase
MGDFRESADALLAANAMVRVDRIQLAARLRALLSDDNERARMGRAAQEVVRIHQGATERTAEALLAILLQRQGSHA